MLSQPEYLQELGGGKYTDQQARAVLSVAGYPSNLSQKSLQGQLPRIDRRDAVDELHLMQGTCVTLMIVQFC